MTFRIVTIVCGTLVLLAVLEFTLRAIDRPATPGPRAVSTDLSPSRRLRAYVDALPVAEGVDRRWFDDVPPPLARTPLPPELADVALRSRSMPQGAELFKRWNARYVQESSCGGRAFFQTFPGFGFVFDPIELSSHPPYRYLPNITSPYGLVTNQFGFRGPPIAADKPAETIRIALVGASTTVGGHAVAFSYPEFLEPWLNRWARTQKPGIHIEIINAGREGISSPDIAAVVRQEVLPLEPDLIVYYEGANQFDFEDLLEKSRRAPPPPANPGGPTLAGTSRFALLRRLDIALRRATRAGAEPRKPFSRIQWPAGVDEQHPEPDSAGLPLDLPQIVHDLDDIRQHAQREGAEFALSSFVWLVHKGLVVDPVNQSEIVRWLNDKNWPATYADIRRMADFQNRVFQAYASSRRLPFLDIASLFPQDPELFFDPIHFNLDGERLHAWLAFQDIVPVLRAAVSAGRLPRPARERFRGLGVPDNFERRDLQCHAYSQYVPAAEIFSVSDFEPDVPGGATAAGDHPRRIITPDGWNAYAAQLEIASRVRSRQGGGVVHWRVHVRSGRITAGVLTPDRSQFVNYTTLEANELPTDLYLEVPKLRDAGWLLIANAARADGQRADVDVDAVTLLVPREGAN